MHSTDPLRGKRALDLFLALGGLLVFLPFGLVIAVILRLTGEGEIFYRQQRVGRGGRPIRVLKFVTMLKDSPNLGSGSITRKDDPRVLPVGRVLRKSKLNEVPQLWNILRGEMSVVGPRPMTSEDFSHYPREIANGIVSVRPGLTGLGSIVFRDEENVIASSSRNWLDCYKEEISPYKGALELWYIAHRSMRLDLKLILLTAWVVLRPASDAYRRWLPGIPERAADATAATGGAAASTSVGIAAPIGTGTAASIDTGTTASIGTGTTASTGTGTAPPPRAAWR